jgi:putative dimethyl sulfoxide reductase chaperone
MAAEPQVYEFLAQALLYPDAAFAAKVAVRACALPVRDSWACILAQALIDVAPDDLQVEHVRLFVNDYGGAPCLPYESVYVDRQVLGASARAVAALYAEWGVEETGEMPDYAPVELAFAAHLARLQAVLEDEAERQVAGRARDRFEREHLCAWLPALGANLVLNARLPFYRELGTALQAVFGAAQNPGHQGQPSAAEVGHLDGSHRNGTGTPERGDCCA